MVVTSERKRAIDLEEETADLEYESSPLPLPPPAVHSSTIHRQESSRWASLVNSVTQTAPSPPSSNTANSAGPNADDVSNDSHSFFPLRLVNIDESHSGTTSTWASRFKGRKSKRREGGVRSLERLYDHDDRHSEHPSWRNASARSADTVTSPMSAYARLQRQSSRASEADPLSIVVVDNDLSNGMGQKMIDKNDIESASNILHVNSSMSTSGPQVSSQSEGTQYKGSRSRTRKATTFWTDRVWPALRHFNNQKFPEPRKEQLYQKEVWYSIKRAAMWASLFFVSNWVVFCCFLGQHLMLYWAYPAICGFFTLPLPLMVALDVPLMWPWVYQFFVLCSVWTWPFFQIGEMYMCGFFRTDPNTCHGLKFLTLFMLLTSYPTITCLVMGQKRTLNMLAAITWLCYGCSVMFEQVVSSPAVWRNPVQYVLYQIFLILLSYAKEKSDRQLFELREQLKNQYRAVQAAQIMERKAEQSKKRFVSYIFHEVRVPLNTALLAVQNLKGEGVFNRLNDDMEDMVHGLMGSLSMMEKVLNDVLSFNRMESGKFAQVRRPFDFHKSIQLAAMSHRAQADMSGVDFIVDLDPRISRLDRFIGDEMRLRQVTSNLVSNALKFTPSGSVHLITSLLYPTTLPDEQEQELGARELVAISEGADRRLSALSAAEMSTFVPPKVFPDLDLEKGDIGREVERNKRPKAGPRSVVVRVEVRDTGVGIATADLDDNRLFSPYVQTEIGRRQGGKGSGLGLALIRQIIQLSGGRLGVDSQVGVGSTFCWFELPYQLRQSTALSAPSTPTVAQMPTGPPIPPHSSLVTMFASPRPGAAAVIPEAPELVELDVLHEEDAASLEPTVALRPQTIPSPINISPCLTEAAPSPTETLLNEDAPPPPPPPPTPRADPLHTLVVDDDILTRKLMSRMLKRLGHEVVTASNGKEGLDTIVASYDPGGRRFDAVFLDNQMPRMSGVEVVRALRQQGFLTFVVGCTGNALREDQEEYLTAGAHELLTKPIHQSAIEEMLVEARRRRDQQVSGDERGSRRRGRSSRAPR